MTRTLRDEAFSTIQDAADVTALEAARVAWLGRKGRLTEEMRTLGALSIEEKKTRGAELNALKEELARRIAERKATLAARALEAQLTQETVDVTLPVRPERQGSIHPVSQVIEEISDIFAEMGFSVAEGPEIEDDFHNFTALNIPPSHPARQMHDTFYLTAEEEGEPRVLRTHTSPVQIRAMQQGTPPFRLIAPGPTYRCDSDATHTPMFHQVEGLVIDDGITFAHLKGCLETFIARFFGQNEIPVRFRSSFFPFTEPSAEVDIGCRRDGGRVVIGEGEEWLEILGCGMVHPNVLRNCGLDPDTHQGFAFGMGIERLAMLKYGMPDLRAFYEGDVRWLSHYGFGAFEEGHP